MTEKNPSEFKINIDDEDPEVAFTSELSEHKLEKLSQRIVFLFILFPCIIGVILLFGYLDLKKRVVATRDTGTIEVKNLAKELETSLSDLETRLADLKNQFPSKVSTIEKKLADLAEEQKKMEKALDQVKKYKASYKSLKKTDESVKKVEEALTGIKNKAQNAEKDIKQLDTKMDQDISLVSETAKRALIELKKLEAKTATLEARTTDLENSQIDAKDVVNVIAKERQSYNQKLEEKLNEISQRIATLQKKINGNPNKPVYQPPVPSEGKGVKPTPMTQPKRLNEDFKEQDISE